MTTNILTCPYCQSQDTETSSDIETEEIFHTCNACDYLWNDKERAWFE